MVWVGLMWAGCLSTPHPQRENNQTAHRLTINLDEAFEILDSTGLRDDGLKVLEEPIYIGDNDEVVFVGDILAQKSPFTIKINQGYPIHVRGGIYRLKTATLKEGDRIVMEDKGGAVFVNLLIQKD